MIPELEARIIELRDYINSIIVNAVGSERTALEDIDHLCEQIELAYETESGRKLNNQ